MSYHIVSIDSANCSLSCRDGQLTCKTAEGERKLPLEDVASIIITSFSASIHSELFLQAAKHGVALIICESFKPVSLVLPANRSTDTLLSRAMLNLTPKARAGLWQKTIDAKCQNQLSLAEFIAPDDKAIADLRATALGKKPHKEAICAKMFWQIFGRSLNEENFTRDRAKGGLNNLLNYGYAVLLSTVLQKLFGIGLDPTFGIGHVARERSTPLAYDLMEPFRPCVDWRVIQWVKQQRSGDAPSPTGGRDAPVAQITGRLNAPAAPRRGVAATPSASPENIYEVTKEYRKWVTGFPLVRADYLELTLEIQGVIEGVMRGFRKAVVENQPRHYKPWMPKDSKWMA
jgi:CRISPR-associated protein Cas1